MHSLTRDKFSALGRVCGPLVWPSVGRRLASGDTLVHGAGRPEFGMFMFSIRHIAHDPVRIACSPVCNLIFMIMFQLPTLSAFSYHMCNMYQFVFKIPPV